MRIIEDSSTRLVIRQYPKDAIGALIVCGLLMLLTLTLAPGIWQTLQSPFAAESSWRALIFLVVLIGAAVFYISKVYTVLLELDADQGWALLHKRGVFRNHSVERPLDQFRGARIQTKISSKRSGGGERHRAILMFDIAGTIYEMPVTSLLSANDDALKIVDRINAWQARRGEQLLENPGNGPPVFLLPSR